MPGRKPTPTGIIKFPGGNKTRRLSKKDIDLRERSEIHLGGNVIKLPDSVKSNTIALKKWIRVTRVRHEAILTWRRNIFCYGWASLQNK